MRKNADIIGAEMELPGVSLTRGRIHQTLQPGFVEQAGWVAQRGTEISIDVLREVAALTAQITVGVGKILTSGLWGGVKELRRK